MNYLVERLLCSKTALLIASIICIPLGTYFTFISFQENLITPGFTGSCFLAFAAFCIMYRCLHKKVEKKWKTAEKKNCNL